MPDIRVKMPDLSVQTFASKEEAIAAAAQMRAAMKASGASTPKPTVDQAFAVGGQAQGEGVFDRVRQWLEGNVQPKLEEFAQKIAPPERSVMDPRDPVSDVMGPFGDTMRRAASGLTQAAAHPIDNGELWGPLAFQAAQMIPAVRGVTTAVSLASKIPGVGRGVNALRSVLGSAEVSAAGGAAGAGAHALDSGSETPGMDTLMGAARQGGMDMLLGGGVAGLGATSRAVGRHLGYRALDPSDTDLAAIWQGEKGTSEGFMPVRAKRLVKDNMPDRGEGGIGGEGYADSIDTRTTAQQASRQGIIDKTMEAQPGGGVSLPKGEFAVDLSKATKGLDDLAADYGGARGGLDPSGDAGAVNRAKELFLGRKPDARPFGTGNQKLLGEPNVQVPLARTPADEFGMQVSPQAGVANRETASFANTPFSDVKGPVPYHDVQYIGEAAGLPAPKQLYPQPPAFPNARPYQSPAAPEFGANRGTGTTMLMPETRAVAEGLMPPRPSTTLPVGFDAAADSLRQIDKDLLRTMQGRQGALGKGQSYVPGPDEEAQMLIRGNLRGQVNEVAPMGELGGQPISLSDLNAQMSRDIPWRDLAKRATGAGDSGMRGSAGMTLGGKPFVRVGESATRFGGAVASTMIRGGEKVMNSATVTPQLARLVALLMGDQPAKYDWEKQ